MTRLEEIIANALAGIPETDVAILAREVVRLRGERAVVVPELTLDDGEEILRSLPAGLPAWEDGNWPLLFNKVREYIASRLRAIPSDRVLGEGMVGVSREEFEGATHWAFDGVDIYKVKHKQGFWFAVRRGNSCMSRAGEWALEPLPSSRTPEFFAEFRFDTFRDALTALRANQGGAAT